MRSGSGKRLALSFIDAVVKRTHSFFYEIVRAFLFGYTIVYVLAAIVVVADAIMNQDSKWKTAADALLFLCVAIGVVLYTFNIRIGLPMLLVGS